LVVRNWLIGGHLLEFEQSGQDRATYGKRLLSNLATDLKARGLNGLGISMLRIAANFTVSTQEFANQRLANSIQVYQGSRQSICYGSPGRISSN